MRVQNSLNYDHKKWPGQKIKRPSMTIPDQTMSMKEILERYTRGLPLGGQKVPMYHGEEDIISPEELRKMDLVDQQEYLQHHANKLERMYNDYNESQKILPEQNALLLKDDKKESQPPPPPPIS